MGQAASGDRLTPRRLRALLALSSALAACGPQAPPPLELRIDTVRALGCAPEDALQWFSLDALGPGPFEPARRQVWRWGEQPAAVPADTRWIRLTARDATGWEGSASARLDVDPRHPLAVTLLLAPSLRSCPLADPALSTPPAAAVACDPDGTLWIAGGLDDETGRRRLVRLDPGVRLADMDGQLALRRADAAAVAWDGALWVSGGRPARDSLAHDTVERVQPGEEAVLLQPPLAIPRAAHAMLRYPDGVWLLVGGRSDASGPLLQRAERWEPQRGSRLLAQPDGRLHPSLRLDADGIVWAAGGWDETGEPRGELWRLLPSSDAFEVASELPPLRDGTLLPFGTKAMLWVGLAPGDGTVRVTSLLPREDGTVHAVPWAPPLPPMRSMRVVSLSGGRLLLLGRDTEGGAHGWWLQPSWRLWASADTSRAPTAICATPDGSIWELDATGGSLRRLPPLLPLEPLPPGWIPAQPPETAAHPSQLLWLDRDDWSLSSGTPRALLAGASVEVADLLFLDFETELWTEGAMRLVLVPSIGSAWSVRVEDGALRAEGCSLTIPTQPEVRWSLLRVEGRLKLSVRGAGERTCPLPPELADEPVRLRVEALEPGSRLRSWRGTRR